MRDTVGHSELAAFAGAASSCAFSMMENAAYIEGELPNVKVSEALRAEVLEVCSRLIGTKHDVQSEIGELLDLTESPDSAVVQVRVARIERRLADDLPTLNGVVQSLERAAATDGGSAYILVAESAVNILDSCTETTAAADRYRDVVRR